ncbi:MAG: DUF4910 domain-containing protein [Planctomycetes bacterium]|nr:DUF4910 domain-containing protein [Planctomycetota bacterium]
MTESPFDRRRFLERLFPLNRSLANEGTDRAFEIIREHLPIAIESVRTGTRVFTWTVPPRWVVEGATLTDEAGNLLADFRRHPLHVGSYSAPFTGWVDRATLARHLATSPAMPDAIPFTFHYYDRDWRLCMEHRAFQAARGDRFHVDIRTRFEEGEVRYGLLTIPGRTPDILLLMCNICHPAIANDSLSGVGVMTSIALRLMRRRPRHTVRLLICPETIGSLCYLHNHESELPLHRAGIFCEMAGLSRPLRLQLSKERNAAIDRAARLALREAAPEREIGEFMAGPANDEKVLDAPGFDVPAVSFVRWPYPEYHTSADDMSIVDDARLDEAERAVERTIELFDSNYVPVRRFRGLLGLSSNGLSGWRRRSEQEGAVLNEMLVLLDNRRDLLAIAEESRHSPGLVAEFLIALAERGLIDPPPGSEPGR